jgi:hypothetical protein
MSCIGYCYCQRYTVVSTTNLGYCFSPSFFFSCTAQPADTVYFTINQQLVLSFANLDDTKRVCMRAMRARTWRRAHRPTTCRRPVPRAPPVGRGRPVREDDRPMAHRHARRDVSRYRADTASILRRRAHLQSRNVAAVSHPEVD